MSTAARPRPRWESTHQRIREAAASLIRRRGLTAPSVADVMNAVGHTVGGFYAHWPSRAALFAEAFADRTRKHWRDLLGTAKQEDPLARAVWIVRQYLSRSHRDADAEGCLLPNVLEDTAAHGDPYRSAVASELGDFADGLAATIAPGDSNGRKQALGLLALMIGGTAIARALGTSALSTEVLEASRALAYSALGVEPDKPIEPKASTRSRAR